MPKSPFGHPQGTMVDGVWVETDDALLTGGSPATTYEPPDDSTYGALRFIDQVTGAAMRLTIENGVATVTPL